MISKNNYSALKVLKNQFMVNYFILKILYNLNLDGSYFVEVIFPSNYPFKPCRLYIKNSIYNPLFNNIG